MTDQAIKNQQITYTIFLYEVIDGLSKKNKSLPSKYFYDEVGDQLFQQIMHLEEYYPMSCEYEILSNEKNALMHLFLGNSRGFNLIEYGAGDAYKTRVLIQHFIKNKVDFIYSPVDISENVLNILEKSLHGQFSELHIDKVVSEYFDALDIISRQNCDKKVILFLGSNIGNFTWSETNDFFRSIAQKCQKGDLFMVGFDLQKDPQTILNAYNDRKGVTRDFNLNLLERINKELNGNFDIGQFYHYPTYDPSTGEAKSYLVSKINQTVEIGNPSVKIHFQTGEPIFTEISRKYSQEQIDDIASNTGLKVVKKYFDKKQFFCEAVLEVV